MGDDHGCKMTLKYLFVIIIEIYEHQNGVFITVICTETLKFDMFSKYKCFQFELLGSILDFSLPQAMFFIKS